MSLVAFSVEEQAEAFGETLTLRLDFRAATVIEGALDMDLPIAVAHIRSGSCSYSVLCQVLWGLLREHHPSVTLDQCLSVVMDKGTDGAKVGFALDALLNRAFPLPAKDDDKKKPQRKPSGQSRSSVAAG